VLGDRVPVVLGELGELGDKGLVRPDRLLPLPD
jgi:hypothetical protein